MRCNIETWFEWRDRQSSNPPTQVRPDLGWRGWPRLSRKEVEALAQYVQDFDPAAVPYGEPVIEVVEDYDWDLLEVAIVGGHVPDPGSLSMGVRAFVVDLRREVAQRLTDGGIGEALTWLSEVEQLRELAILALNEAQALQQISDFLVIEERLRGNRLSRQVLPKFLQLLVGAQDET